jgi:metal-responsive CopG/Arc/MetJ family transcriptional regulator
MEPSTVMAVLIDKRSEAAPQVQELLTEFGCIIETRLGLHELKEDNCLNKGLVLLTLDGEQKEINNLRQRLETIHDGVQTNSMELEFSS